MMMMMMMMRHTPFLLFLLALLSSVTDSTRRGPKPKEETHFSSSHPAVGDMARFALGDFLKRAPFSSSVSAWKGSTIEVKHARRRVVHNDHKPELSSKNYYITMLLISPSGRCATHEVDTVRYRSGARMVVGRQVSEHPCGSTVDYETMPP